MRRIHIRSCAGCGERGLVNRMFLMRWSYVNPKTYRPHSMMYTCERCVLKPLTRMFGGEERRNKSEVWWNE